MKHSVFGALARASAILLVAALTLPLALSGCTEGRAERKTAPVRSRRRGTPRLFSSPR